MNYASNREAIYTESFPRLLYALGQWALPLHPSEIRYPDFPIREFGIWPCLGFEIPWPVPAHILCAPCWVCGTGLAWGFESLWPVPNAQSEMLLMVLPRVSSGYPFRPSAGLSNPVLHPLSLKMKAKGGRVGKIPEWRVSLTPQGLLGLSFIRILHML